MPDMVESNMQMKIIHESDGKNQDIYQIPIDEENEEISSIQIAFEGKNNHLNYDSNNTIEPVLSQINSPPMPTGFKSQTMYVNLNQPIRTTAQLTEEDYIVESHQPAKIEEGELLNTSIHPLYDYYYQILYEELPKYSGVISAEDAQEFIDSHCQFSSNEYRTKIKGYDQAQPYVVNQAPQAKSLSGVKPVD